MSPSALRFLLLSCGLLLASVFIYVRAVAGGAPPATALTGVGITVLIALFVYGTVGQRRPGAAAPGQRKKYLIRALIGFAVLNAIITALVLLVLPASEMRTPAIVSGFWTILPMVIAVVMLRRK